MTSKGLPSNALGKARKQRTGDWPPPPLVFHLPPAADNENAAHYSAVASHFYGDFRVTIRHMLSELGALQVTGVLVMKVVDSRPRGTMPDELWDELRPQFQEKLRGLLLGHSIAAEIPEVRVKAGYCRLKLWLVPDVQLALRKKLDHIPPEMEQFDQRIRSMPDDYAARYKALQELSHEFRSEVARQLGPAMNRHLQEMPQDSYDDKQKLASWVNAQLRELGLAIKCPKTGKPATLVADIRGADDETSRFRLDIRTDSGRHARTFTANTLPELELMESEPRREGLAKEGRSQKS